MINYISRDKLIEDCDYQIKKPSNKEVHVTMNEAFAHFKELVLLHPTADVEEVKHGTWIKLDTAHEYTDVYKCSICNRRIWDDKGIPLSKIYERNPYCHCGAKMNAKEKDNG